MSHKIFESLHRHNLFDRKSDADDVEELEQIHNAVQHSDTCLADIQTMTMLYANVEGCRSRSSIEYRWQLDETSIDLSQ